MNGVGAALAGDVSGFVVRAVTAADAGQASGLIDQTVVDPTDSGSCDGKFSGSYDHKTKDGKTEKRCQHGYVWVSADPSSGVQVQACSANPSAPSAPNPQGGNIQAYGYVYVDSTGKHAPGDYGDGHVGASDDQHQSPPAEAPCDRQP